MESIVVDNYTINILLIIVFVIIFLLILGAIIYYALSCGTIINNIPLGGNCIDNNCLVGLICQNNICKSSINGTCDHLSDCISGSTACQNGICTDRPLSGIGGIPPCKAGLVNDNGICKVKIGGVCNKDSDCSSGNGCYNGKCNKKKLYTNSSDSSYRYSSNFTSSDISNKSSNISNKSSDKFNKSPDISNKSPDISNKSPDISIKSSDKSIKSSDKSIKSSDKSNKSSDKSIKSSDKSIIEDVEKINGKNEESIYRSQKDSLANIYQKIRSKNKYGIDF